MTSQKNAFWQALVITIIIFGIGVLFGVILENMRTSQISDLYQQSELELLDIKLQSEIYSLGDFDCQKAVEENLNFANKIFEEARTLDKYESASRLTDKLKIHHKRYDLLRTNLLLNSIKIKEKCTNGYYEVVYFYQYNEASFETKAKQAVFSKLLVQLKEEKGYEILLIPIAGDNDISAVNLLLDEYNINELPTILINRKDKITEVQTAEELSKYFR
tara:strand:- start:630 stop:1283 length:654 start_codon:yes stop_codon:yes gene_type:complete